MVFINLVQEKYMLELNEIRSQVSSHICNEFIVRVGGGYLSIDEFLDIYTPMELERLDRNDPIKKFSEKVAVQKTLEFNSAERSPNRIISSRQFESEQRIKNKRDRSTSEQYL